VRHTVNKDSIAGIFFSLRSYQGKNNICSVFYQAQSTVTPCDLHQCGYNTKVPFSATS